MWSPPDPGKGVEGESADVAGRKGGRIGKWMGACWFLDAPKIMGARPHKMGARPHSESTQNNRGAPSSCGRFGDFLLFFIAAKS